MEYHTTACLERAWLDAVLGAKEAYPSAIQKYCEWVADEGNEEMRQPSALGMLIGEYTHTLDPKKRVSLPAKFRKELGTNVVITRGLDNCLFVYSMREWGQIAAKVAELPIGQSDTRGFNRFLLSGAVETEVDSAGRILIPDFLKDFAKLKEKIVLAGVHSRVELWDAEAWVAYKEHIEKQADQMAEKLGEYGVL